MYVPPRSGIRGRRWTRSSIPTWPRRLLQKMCVCIHNIYIIYTYLSLSLSLSLHIYIYIYYACVYMYIYIYIHICTYITYIHIIYILRGQGAFVQDVESVGF